MRIVQGSFIIARFKNLKLGTMFLVSMLLCSNWALRSLQFVGTPPTSFGGRISGSSWTVADSPTAAEFLASMTVSRDEPCATTKGLPPGLWRKLDRSFGVVCEK